MALDKSINSGKEHRVQYGKKNQPYAKAVDKTCRNHGSCPLCRSNRMHKSISKNKLMKKEIIDFFKNY